MQRTRERVYTAGRIILPLETRQSVEDTHQMPPASGVLTRIQAPAWAAQAIPATIPTRQACFRSR